MSISGIRLKLRKISSPKKAKLSQRFFKTGPGQYGCGDKFIGVTVPEIRLVAGKYLNLSQKDILSLLYSKIHEERLLSLIVLVQQYRAADKRGQKAIYDFYLKHRRQVNNWDLVDSSAAAIVGHYLMDKDKKVLYKLAKSTVLWDRRIAIVSSHHFIRNGQFEDTLKLSKLLLKDTHDLMHKASGWMLRELGKKNTAVLEAFLKQNHSQMPRTMLRYAIERLPKPKIEAFLYGDA